MKKILVCNQKMYLTYDEAVILNEEMNLIDFSSLNVIVCPSYLNLDVFSNFPLGAQDAFYEKSGAYTGEISAYDLSLRGIKYSIIGHSERRRYDTDSIINLKVKALLENSMIPILCIGEEKNDKELMRTGNVLKKQLTSALKDINMDVYQEIYIAYEPRYLIGGKNALNKNDIIDTFNYIKKIAEGMGVNNYKLLYGGAVNSSNLKDLNCDEIDGFLLGASSVSIEELKNIVKCIK